MNQNSNCDDDINLHSHTEEEWCDDPPPSMIPTDWEGPEIHEIETNTEMLDQSISVSHIAGGLGLPKLSLD